MLRRFLPRAAVLCALCALSASALVVGACFGAAAPAPAATSAAAPVPEVSAESTPEMTAEMTAEATAEMTAEMTATAAAEQPAEDGQPAAASLGEIAAARPAWHSLPLTDARTGAPFTLAVFAGKTVFVEPFATWCTNCRQQLANVHAAKQQAAQLGRNDIVFVALSVEPNIGDAALAEYAAATGYDLIFAAMPTELLQALAAEFGQTVANPPATPHFVLQPDGTAGPLVTGIEAPAAILAQVGVQE